MSKDNGSGKVEAVKAEIIVQEDLTMSNEDYEGLYPNMKLTPKLANKIIKYVKAGNYAQTVCQLVGIHNSTYTRWMQRAKKGERPFAQFAQRIEQAKANAELSMVLELRKAGKETRNWGALKFLLERTRPENFGSKNLELIGGIEGKPVEVKIIIEDVYGSSEKNKNTKMATK